MWKEERDLKKERTRECEEGMERERDREGEGNEEEERGDGGAIDILLLTPSH